MIREGKLKINNVPPYAMTQPFPYWLCTVQEEGDVWFHGAYRTRERAEQARREGPFGEGFTVNAIIVERIEDES